jgi:radical SAM protein with 4Fe4S-binding SPASM domain
VTSLVHVVWELTLQCDLACKHCGSRAGKPRAAELTTEECLDVVAQLAEMGAKEVSLIGGEAYLREDWDVIAAAIVDSGMVCTMVSGGRSWDSERALRALAAGLASVSVSIDGMARAHDEQRGLLGSFTSAVRSMRALRQAGVEVTANSQLNKRSIEDLDAMLDLFIELGVTGWQVAMTVPMGRAADRPEWLLQPPDLLELFPRLAHLANRARAAGIRIFPGNNVGYFGPHEDALRGVTFAGTGVEHFEGCVAGVSLLGIEADGAIKGCPSLPTTSYAGGNVRERRIREIWEGASELAFARDPRAMRGELWGFCAGCYYADVCRGGCSWTAHVFFGRRGNNPYCHHRALEHAERGLRERLVPISRAPGVPFDHGLFDVVVEPVPRS